MELKKLKCTVLKLINNNNFKSALRIIREGLSIDLYDSDLYLYMGLIYKYKKNYNCAFLCFENALQYSKDEEAKSKSMLEINKLKESQLISVSNYSIIILTFNNLSYTQKCIESVRKYNSLDNYEIIVIDNNSIDNTPAWLKSQKDIKFILNDENKGFPAGCNQGIEFANEDNDIFLLNNDTILMPNSIFNLRMALYSNENVGAASSVSNNAPYQRIQENYEDVSDYLNYSLKNNITNNNRYEYRLKLIGFALLLKKTVLRKVGLLDELFTPGNYEDDDLGLRMTKLGYKNVLCKDSFIYHYGNISFGRNPERYFSILNINKSKFEAKWKFDPLKSLCTRNDILELIDESYDAQFNVLEVGCACGGTLLEIKNKYPNANIYGFELNNAAAEIARSFTKVINGDIETAFLNFNEAYFDYIIFADVIQYLNDPLKTLENIKKYLKYDGHILAGITNVLNFKILKDLIDGNWRYENKGFLDNSQLRFFTYRDILKMFEDAGYNNIFITSMANMPESIEDEEFIDIISSLSHYRDIKEELVNYEYYIKAQKTNDIDSQLKEKKKIKNQLNIIVKELDKDFHNNSLLNTLITLVINENIAVIQIIEAIENKSEFQGEILNSIAVKCLENNLTEYVLPLLEKAYSLNPGDLDITYNLCSSLIKKKDYSLALDYLNSLYSSNDDIERLKCFIADHID